jgi:hypothetical protein
VTGGGTLAFLQYVDLCNEQAYLHDSRRVLDDTWFDWRDGIEHTFRLPYFELAWRYIYLESNRLEPRTGQHRSYERLADIVPPADRD